MIERSLSEREWNIRCMSFSDNLIRCRWPLIIHQAPPVIVLLVVTGGCDLSFSTLAVAETVTLEGLFRPTAYKVTTHLGSTRKRNSILPHQRETGLNLGIPARRDDGVATTPAISATGTIRGQKPIFLREWKNTQVSTGFTVRCRSQPSFGLYPTSHMSVASKSSPSGTTLITSAERAQSPKSYLCSTPSNTPLG